jgi:hypothetical protein
MAWTPPARRVSQESPGTRGEAAALISQLHHATLPKARKLIDIWTNHQPEGMVVGRDVPSREIAPLLSSLVLYEPVNGGEDWRIRLAGAALLRRFGRDVAGCLISALYPRDHFHILCRRAQTVLETNRPQIDDVLVRSSDAPLLHFETVHVPVFAPGGEARWDMAGYFYFD